MWITKKKHMQEVFDASRKAYERQHEAEQSDKLWELENDVKKLKKQVRKLKNALKNGW